MNFKMVDGLETKWPQPDSQEMKYSSALQDSQVAIGKKLPKSSIAKSWTQYVAI